MAAHLFIPGVVSQFVLSSTANQIIWNRSNKQLVAIKMKIKVIDKQHTLWRRTHSLVLHGGGRPLLWLMWHKTAITNLEQSNQCVPIFTSNVVPVCVPSSMTFNIQPLRSSLYGWYFVMTLDPCIKTILESSYCMYWYCHVIQYVFHSLLSLCSSPSTNINLWFNSMGLVKVGFVIWKLGFSRMFFIAANWDKKVSPDQSLIVTFAGVPRPPTQGGGATPSGRQDQRGDPPRPIMQVRLRQTLLYRSWNTFC